MISDELFPLFLPWLIFFGLVLIFKKLFSLAKKQKAGAIIFGALIQMMMPDPYAERTVKVVQEDKKTIKKEQDENEDDDKAKEQDKTPLFLEED